MLREVYRRPGVPQAMRGGNATLVAQRMRAAGYFEAPAELYARAIANNAATIAKNLGERLAIDLDGVSPLPRGPFFAAQPSRGPHPLVIAAGLGLVLWGLKQWGAS